MTTIKDALSEMELDYRAAGRSENTVNAYNRMVGDFAKFCGKPLESITREDVRDYFIQLRERNAYADAPQKFEESRKLSPHTVAAYDRHLRGFFSWCEDIGMVERSPMRGMKRPRPPKLKPKAITARQFVRLLQAAREYPDPVQSARNVALLATLGDTGTRVSELLSLSSETVDLDERRAWVLLKGTEREVFFSYFTSQLIREWLILRDSHDKHIFTSMTTGEALTGSGVDQMLKRLKKQSGVRGKVSAHRFRHGFAVEFVKSGGDVSVLASLLGHDSITTTAAFYTVFSGDELKKMHAEYSPLRALMQG